MSLETLTYEEALRKVADHKQEVLKRTYSRTPAKKVPAKRRAPAKKVPAKRRPRFIFTGIELKEHGLEDTANGKGGVYHDLH